MILGIHNSIFMTAATGLYAGRVLHMETVLLPHRWCVPLSHLR